MFFKNVDLKHLWWISLLLSSFYLGMGFINFFFFDKVLLAIFCFVSSGFLVLCSLASLLIVCFDYFFNKKNEKNKTNNSFQEKFESSKKCEEFFKQKVKDKSLIELKKTLSKGDKYYEQK